jgi:hypothetical protein
MQQGYVRPEKYSAMVWVQIAPKMDIISHPARVFEALVERWPPLGVWEARALFEWQLYQHVPEAPQQKVACSMMTGV